MLFPLVLSALLVGQLHAQAVSASASVDIGVNGLVVPGEAAAMLKAVLGSGDQSLPLIEAVPPPMQDKLPVDVKQSLQTETVSVLKSELAAVKEVLLKAYQAGAVPADLVAQLKAAAPVTAKLVEQLIALLKQKYAQFKAKLDAAGQQFMQKLEQLLSDKYAAIVDQIKQKWNALDVQAQAELKVSVTASVASQ